MEYLTLKSIKLSLSSKYWVLTQCRPRRNFIIFAHWTIYDATVLYGYGGRVYMYTYKKFIIGSN